MADPEQNDGVLTPMEVNLFRRVEKLESEMREVKEYLQGVQELPIANTKVIGKGKYKTKTPEQVIELDPQYVVFIWEAGYTSFKFTEAHYEAAKKKMQEAASPPHPAPPVPYLESRREEYQDPDDIPF